MLWRSFLALAALLGSAMAVALPTGEFRVEQLPTDLDGVWQLRQGPEAPWRRAGGWRPVAVPGAWEEGPAPGYDGHAWYRVQLRLAADLPIAPLGVAFSRIRDADEVFLNGYPVGHTGSFPPKFQKAPLWARVYPLPDVLLHRGGVNELAVHVYNQARWGGIVGAPPRVGALAQLLAAEHQETYLILAFAVFFLMVAANHAFLFVQRPAFRINLLFALFALLSAAFVLTFASTLGPLWFSFNLLYRLNVALFPLCVLLLVWFLHAFLERRVPLTLRGAFFTLGAIAALTLMWPRLDDLYLAVEATEWLAAALIASAAWLLVTAVRRRVPYARVIAAVSGLLLLAGLWDLGVDQDLLPRPPLHVAGLLFPAGFVPFYVVLGLILAKRHWEYYHQSTFDRLTGLMQRHFFLQRLGEESERAMRGGQRLVVSMLDLDGFKEVNDDYSHAAGDAVLRSVAAVVQSSIRPFDLAGRYGGDELCVAMAVDDAATGVGMLERLRGAVATHRVVHQGKELAVTASIGAVVVDPQRLSSDVDALLEEADAALYRAKAAGGDRIEVDRRL